MMENNPNMAMGSSSKKTGVVIALFIGLVLGLIIGNLLPKMAGDQGARPYIVGPSKPKPSTIMEDTVPTTETTTQTQIQ